MQKLIITLVLVASIAPVKAKDVAGRANVIDGDTIAVEGVESRIRLHGIDAPEGKQICDDDHGRHYLCGTRSADALSNLIGRNGTVSCTETGRDRYGRIIAICHSHGREINREMVRLGWAADFRRYSNDMYATEEKEAQSAKRGLWAGQFVLPWEWRKGKRLTSEQGGGTSRECSIKGNISSAGAVYHIPGSIDYARTVIDESRGERWFCSEEEAKAAGWRPPRG
ncbi:thermonuclease family protein [Pseudochelatococcus sp. G4_1912]|uniref:thermonuclease family protein n=1 Tax=Pseudochelatococcus sp. G4_1912 TaxID=3114288 RepID=UPI0039C70DD1